MNARADVVVVESDSFTVDTRFEGSGGTDESGLFVVDTRWPGSSSQGESPLLTVDTRYGSGTSSGDSGFFTVDTRFGSSSGVGVSGFFTVDTRSVGIPSVGVTSVSADYSGRTSYQLNLVTAPSAQVTVAVSLNGGVSYDILPAPNSLTGDAGSGVAAGQRTLYWNPAQSLPPGTFSANCRVMVIATAGGVTSGGVSPLFTVDVRGIGSGIVISGRALDAQTGAALAGATVTVGGQSVTTAANGSYVLNNVSLAAGNTLTVSQAGQSAHTETVTVAPGTQQATVDTRLPPATAAGKPVVTRIKSEIEGLFLDGANFENDYTASVNWNGATPGTVFFYANNTLIASRTGPGPQYVGTFNMRTAFAPSLRVGANRVRVVARSAANVSSDVKTLDVAKIPLPPALASVVSYVPFNLYPGTFAESHLGLDWEIPKRPIKSVFTLPWLGRFGAEFRADVSVDYDIPTGEWELQFGLGDDFDVGKRGARPKIPGLTRVPKTKLYLGNEEAEMRAYGKATGRASPSTGWGWDEFEVGVSLATRFELTRYGVADLITPGVSTLLGKIPGLEKTLKNTSVIVWAKPELSGAAVLTPFPEFDFKRLEISGKLGIEAAYEPEFTKRVKARVYVGGEPSVTFQTPGELLREARFKVYAGLEVQAWLFTFGPHEVVLLEWVYSGGSAQRFLPAGIIQPSLESIHVASRRHLAAGGERFVGSEGSMLAGGSGSTVPTPLEAFRLVGRRKVIPAGQFHPASDSPNQGPAQADLPLIQNVYPESDPALAARGQELMLLYVADNGGSNSLQFTDIKWTRFDGTNWSAPATILADTRAEFSPRVAFDGNGDAIAVWERVADTNFDTVDLTAMAAQMEIVWSRWSRTNGSWTTPAALTANSYLDHQPLLCGPMTNGDVLLTWTRNTANELMGTNAAGTTGNSDVLWSRWAAASRSWDAPQTLVENLAFQLSESLAGTGNRAVYAWTRDLSGGLTNDAAQEVFYVQWTNGAWAGPVQLATNEVADRNVRAAVSAAGDGYLVWQQGTNLVVARNFSNGTRLVREDSATAGFADYALTFGPAGNLALVWQEMSDTGSDAHYRIYDPASDSWSEDARLFADATLERSFAPVWDDTGNLTMAYNRVAIMKTNKTVALEAGGSVTITNVPQPGRVDLAVVKRALIKDLALLPGDFVVQGENFLPNAALTLTAQVRNLGDVGVNNVTVAFYHGNPVTGGVLITNVPVLGWVLGASNATVSALWVVPETGVTQTLYAVADPGGLVTEFNETNNTQSVSVGGVDLVVSLLSTEAETNGALRVIAQVQNAGAPGAGPSQLALRRVGETNAPLAMVSVPMLEPGRLAQVALDLPPGSLLEGETWFWLRADEGVVAGDVNAANNSISFAVNLVVDTDGDGMPDAWETAHNLDPHDPTDANADPDGDGVPNLAEYLAGTDPQAAASYLRVDSIGASPGVGVELTWGSVAGRLYTILRSPALPGGFAPVATHVQSTPPQNIFLDSSATNAGPYFYRLLLE